MDASSAVGRLDKAAVSYATESKWIPTGPVGVANAKLSAAGIAFELIVPTSESDIWDYIWSSEREAHTTDKVQLYQGHAPVPDSRIVDIKREGKASRWDAPGPERYRLAFSVPATAIDSDVSLEVRFFWQGRLLATAG
jgi:hypothetical protein